MVLYAWRTSLLPTSERRANGCPATGWVHEPGPPWRVIAGRSADELACCGYDRFTVAAYDGDEPTVSVGEWLGPGWPKCVY